MLSFGENKMTVPERMEKDVFAFAGKTVVLGIRPDDFHFEEFYKTAIAQTVSISFRRIAR